MFFKMCNLCLIKPVYEFTNKRKLCSRCFINWFQKKFLYTIRTFEMIQKEDIVGYENKGDFRGVVLEELLKIFAEKSMIEIVKLPNKKITKKASSSTKDLESEKIIEILIKKDAKELNDLAPVKGDVIKPLYLFLDKEVLLYAELKKLKFKEVEKEKDSIISELEKKHPEIKHAIVQSYLELF
jgi:hypothetical protein